VLLQHFQALPAGFDRCGHCDNCVRLAKHAAQEARQASAREAEDAALEAPTTPRPCFAPGDEVRVRRYGRGRVTAADALSVNVEFANGEQRSFLPDWVRALSA
jgi:ATP-dependent DNA helicase RecQ